MSNQAPDYPARLLRLVNSSDLPPGIVATLDFPNNLVRVSREWWENATQRERLTIERMESPLIELIQDCAA